MLGSDLHLGVMLRGFEDWDGGEMNVFPAVLDAEADLGCLGCGRFFFFFEINALYDQKHSNKP